MSTVIVTPDQPSAENLHRAYAFSKDIICSSISSCVTGQRYSRVIILPIPEHWTEHMKHKFRRAVQEHFKTLMEPKGEIIEL